MSHGLVSISRTGQLIGGLPGLLWWPDRLILLSRTGKHLWGTWAETIDRGAKIFSTKKRGQRLSFEQFFSQKTFDRSLIAPKKISNPNVASISNQKLIEKHVYLITVFWVRFSL